MGGHRSEDRAKHDWAYYRDSMSQTTRLLLACFVSVLGGVAVALGFFILSLKAIEFFSGL